ncbi:T9SS type A sorting domain-containing protein [Aquimarina litoralis]|uniref:T9SS type A sorting domain-containing protein n=1 Tax=Aquimarina litoralis TaxID=584605 RepID=UPI001C59544F|nr:T9SS type A sorting domain-containing protein [Aquimarina litoralis]MBW1297690.1 T9SS type A sorting domain-containing protein [Aquimarina litoralis]
MKTTPIASLILFLFCCVVHSQDDTFVRGNKINLVLSVTDAPGDSTRDTIQKLEMIIPSSLELNKKRDIRLKVILDYRSNIDTVRYFRLSKTVIPLAPYGASLPVIIPPIKKTGDDSETFNNTDTYPYIFETPFNFPLKEHRLHLSLREYDNVEDYLTDDLGTKGVIYQEKMIKISFVNRQSKNTAIDIEETPSLYPNPFDNQLTMEFLVSDTSKVSNDNLTVSIFNNIGVRVMYRELKTNAPREHIQYNLDTSILKKGIYYCQINNGGKTFLRTIIKK